MKLKWLVFTTLILLIPSQLSAFNWDYFMKVPYIPSEMQKIFLDQHNTFIEVKVNGETGIKKNRSTINWPLQIGETTYSNGLGMHAPSHIRIHSPQKIVRFEAWVGLSAQPLTGQGSVDFIVASESGKEYANVKNMRDETPAKRIDVKINNANTLDLIVGDSGDGISCDHANWCDAVIHLEDGTRKKLGDMELRQILVPVTQYPFSFIYDKKKSDDLLSTWDKTVSTKPLDEDRTQTVMTWTDPKTKLAVQWTVIRFKDYPDAIDMLLHFENAGTQETPILENILALSYSLNQSLNRSSVAYRLYHTNGSPSTENDFLFRKIDIRPGETHPLKAAGGRSSNGDFPFYKIDHASGSLITAVGWSGQWKTDLQCNTDGRLDMFTGLEKTHFRLYPQEKVRMPRMLLFDWTGDTWESNAKFRKLIYKHYAAKRNGKPILPTPFCNTCFTRGGGWLNETTAENQISLINAYADLGVMNIMTDAGWFVGGWPNGAGNWTPDPEKYPGGMAPVAKASLERGGAYGLWFEPERVVSGTPIHKEHPEWCLASHAGDNHTYLLNFGLPEVRQYFFNIVKGFMDLPGFEIYRQDFNMDPLSFWQYNDAPDRQGITEIKYIEGLYEYWDMIANAYPDSLREECASGGRRIDLETVMRMHMHQDSDYWFQWDTDQNQVWGMSQYLPNSVFVGHLHNLDEYGFWANMPTSLCFGWIADAPDFDKVTAKKFMDKYLAYRDLLVEEWYPLFMSTKDKDVWMGAQYHSTEQDKGIVVLQRRVESPYVKIQLKLRALDPNARYAVTEEKSGKKWTDTGKNLMERFYVEITEAPGTAVYLYQKTQ